MRLVKDNDQTFHFQWDKPLKEERIILIRRTGEVVNYRYEFNTSGLHEHKTTYLHETDIEILVYFPTESFVSAPVSSQDNAEPFYGDTAVRYIYSVEIAPADLRNTAVDFPAHLYTINDGGKFVRHGDQVILRDHPLFREYRIGKPSRLDFAVD